jgi:hypothetical protein
VAFLAWIAAAARPGRHKAVFPAHAPRRTVTVLPWLPAGGPVPAFAGTASVAALPRCRGTPTSSPAPALIVTGPPRATGTFTGRLAAAISAASLPRPTCVPGPAAAVRVMVPPCGPGAPA